jgi:hypothetical protein
VQTKRVEKGECERSRPSQVEGLTGRMGANQTKEGPESDC